MRLLAALCCALLPALAWAQKQNMTGERAAPREGIQVVHDEGDYQGVQPGRSRRHETPAPPKKRPAKPTVTWIGFQALEGGTARIFVQASTQITFDQQVRGDELVVTLSNIRLGNYNFSRFMDTTFFDTAITRVKAQRGGRGKKGDVEIHIKFKGGGAKQADAHAEPAQDGYQYLYLDFGAAPGGGDEQTGGGDG